MHRSKQNFKKSYDDSAFSSLVVSRYIYIMLYNILLELKYLVLSPIYNLAVLYNLKIAQHIVSDCCLQLLLLFWGSLSKKGPLVVTGMTFNFKLFSLIRQVFSCRGFLPTRLRYVQPLSQIQCLCKNAFKFTSSTCWQ